MEDGKALCEKRMLTIEYKKNKVHLASNCMGVQGLYKLCSWDQAQLQLSSYQYSSMLCAPTTKQRHFHFHPDQVILI